MPKTPRLSIALLALAIASPGAVAAEDWRGGEIAAAAQAYAEPAAATLAFGRASQLGQIIHPVEGDGAAPASAFMDCSSEPLVGGSSTPLEVRQPFACYAQPQWPDASFQPAGLFDDLLQ